MGDAWSAKTWAALEENAARQVAGPAATVAATTEATATSAPPHAEESRNGAGAAYRGAFLRGGGVHTMPPHSVEALAPASALLAAPAAEGVAPPLELQDVAPTPDELSPPDGAPARAHTVQEDSSTFSHGGDAHGEGGGDLVHGLLPPEYRESASRELTSPSTSSSCSYYASAVFCGTYSCGKGCSAAATCSICTCSAGYYSASGSAAAVSTCDACPAGQYRSTTGATSCVSCPTGQYNPYTAQTWCYSCPSGQSQPYSSYSATSCFTSTGTSLSVADSAWCGTGTAGCGKGCSYTYALTCTVYECIPGYYLAYGYTTTQTTGCTACSAGYYGTTFQATSCWTACGSGTYSSAGASSCTSCPTGQYQPYTGYSYCFSCPGGQYQNVAAQTSCKGCPGGYYCPAGSAAYYPCPGGYYCPAGSSTYKGCPGGYFCPSYSSSYNSCPAGYYCPSYVFFSLLVFSASSDHPSLSFLLHILSAATSPHFAAYFHLLFIFFRYSWTYYSCATGTYSPIASSSCPSCPGGQYQNVAAQTSCKGCPGVSDFTHLQSCNFCSRNRFF
jgi:syndecan 4